MLQKPKDDAVKIGPKMQNCTSEPIETSKSDFTNTVQLKRNDPAFFATPITCFDNEKSCTVQSWQHLFYHSFVDLKRNKDDVIDNIICGRERDEILLKNLQTPCLFAGEIFCFWEVKQLRKNDICGRHFFTICATNIMHQFLPLYQLRL